MKISIEKLKLSPWNPRKITEARKEALKKSLKEFGTLQPIIWNKQTGNVIGGNQRLLLYKEAGVKEVDVFEVDLNERLEKAAALRLNRHDGEWDNPLLKDILLDLDAGDIDLSLTGFEDDEVARLMEQIHEEEPLPNETEKPVEEDKIYNIRDGDTYICQIIAKDAEYCEAIISRLKEVYPMLQIG